MNPHEVTGESLRFVGTLGAIGAVIGLGQLLNSQERVTLRLAAGRAVCSAGLGACASVVMVWYPDLPVAVTFGIAALFASLGTSGLERLSQRLLGRT